MGEIFILLRFEKIMRKEQQKMIPRFVLLLFSVESDDLRLNYIFNFRSSPFCGGGYL